jgi:ribose transport system ATP-binding protein
MVLEVEELVSGRVGPVSFHVAAGETLGLVGLRGAGHHTVGRAIFGQLPLEAGRVLIDGTAAVTVDPADAMRRGIGFVSSRRSEESVATNMSLKENLYLNPATVGHGVFDFIPRHIEDRAAQAAIERFSIKAENPQQTVATLTGGNQQKVVVARWMESSAKVLILEEPTIGVDVGSKAEIYSLLQVSLAAGMAVLLISSDFEEVERICHRSLVFSRGNVVAELSGDRLTIANLTASAAGVAVEPQRIVA